ncbi:hypothetical protein SeMB42_g04772 [Synchytrium endobioticum]|uniref:RanBD1 domain-containing protein n=1 Tax=Synchytrium endobioticum TaxID=286115 RepID=A0A507CW86_9FUNG|nr:hypothetical protein SeMB42_g04772 [Synchytrium endobioticum]
MKRRSEAEHQSKEEFMDFMPSQGGADGQEQGTWKVAASQEISRRQIKKPASRRAMAAASSTPSSAGSGFAGFAGLYPNSTPAPSAVAAAPMPSFNFGNVTTDSRDKPQAIVFPLPTTLSSTVPSEGNDSSKFAWTPPPPPLATSGGQPASSIAWPPFSHLRKNPTSTIAAPSPPTVSPFNPSASGTASTAFGGFFQNSTPVATASMHSFTFATPSTDSSNKPTAPSTAAASSFTFATPSTDSSNKPTAPSTAAASSFTFATPSTDSSNKPTAPSTAAASSFTFATPSTDSSNKPTAPSTAAASSFRFANPSTDSSSQPQAFVFTPTAWTPPSLFGTKATATAVAPSRQPDLSGIPVSTSSNPQFKEMARDLMGLNVSLKKAVEDAINTSAIADLSALFRNYRDYRENLEAKHAVAMQILNVESRKSGGSSDTNPTGNQHNSDSTGKEASSLTFLTGESGSSNATKPLYPSVGTPQFLLSSMSSSNPRSSFTTATMPPASQPSPTHSFSADFFKMPGTTTAGPSTATKSLDSPTPAQSSSGAVNSSFAPMPPSALTTSNNTDTKTSGVGNEVEPRRIDATSNRSPFASFGFPPVAATTSATSSFPSFSFSNVPSQPFASSVVRKDDQGGDDVAGNGEEAMPPEPQLEVKSGAGEETDKTLFESRSKLFVFNPEATEADKKWRVAGVGDMKVNEDVKTRKGRLLMKVEGGLVVLLNCNIFAGFHVSVANDSKDARFLVPVKGFAGTAALEGPKTQNTMVQFMLKFRSHELAKQFAKVIIAVGYR